MTPEPVCIGPASLYCGDAYAIRPTLGRMDVDVMDPPYLFDNSGGGAFRKARGASDRIVADGFDRGFDHRIIDPLLAPSVIVFCHNDQLADLLAHLRGMYRRAVVLFWAKENPSPHRNRNYLADTEPFIHAWNEGYHPIGEHHDMHRWIEAGSLPSKVWDHPTVKPDKVMTKILRNANGMRICDPFMGTGSTGVAALRAGRRFWGIEKDPAHFATAVNRISAAWESLCQPQAPAGPSGPLATAPVGATAGRPCGSAGGSPGDGSATVQGAASAPLPGGKTGARPQVPGAPQGQRNSTEDGGADASAKGQDS